MQSTIALPDALQQALIEQAAQSQTSPEQLIIQVLKQYLQPAITTADTDQLLSLIGTLELSTTDLAKNHDQYLGSVYSTNLG